MSDLKINSASANQVQKQEQQNEAVETGGVIASATNTPSPLFNAVPVETGGSIASSGSSSSSSGGGTSFVC